MFRLYDFSSCVLYSTFQQHKKPPHHVESAAESRPPLSVSCANMIQHSTPPTPGESVHPSLCSQHVPWGYKIQHPTHKTHPSSLPPQLDRFFPVLFAPLSLCAPLFAPLSSPCTTHITGSSTSSTHVPLLPRCGKHRRGPGPSAEERRVGRWVGRDKR